MGISNSEARTGNNVKAIMGKRIMEARNAIKLTRKTMAERLSSNILAPIENKRETEFSQDRLKQWEYGNNPVPTEWIPAICDVLDVDVGYLFGDYEEHKRVAADMVHVSGLSEAACTKLESLKREHDLGAYADCLSLFIEDSDFTYFLALLSGITDSEGDNLISADSGKSRIQVRRIELTRFAIQNTAINIANRMREIFPSRYKTISQRQDERWVEIAWKRFNEGKISAQNRDELIAMVYEGKEANNGND